MKILLIVWIAICSLGLILTAVDIFITAKLIKLERDWEASQSPGKPLPRGFWRLWRKE
jgi:hypothetical protein